MYITKDYREESNQEENFDWQKYFSDNVVAHCPASKEELFFNIRKLLSEDKISFGLTITKLMKQLLKETHIKTPTILELGAATGFLSRWLLSEYGGEASLVDNSRAAKERFLKSMNPIPQNIQYINSDIFEFSCVEKFDLVCSYGLIEHFSDKTKVLNVHKKFLSEHGYMIIIVPLDSILSRVFWESHPELNLGYRELLTEKEFITVLMENGLKVLKTTVSDNYVYDSVAALCVK